MKMSETQKAPPVSQRAFAVALLLAVAALLGLALAAGVVRAGPAALTLTVDSTLDEPDATPGDGTCASTPSGQCTLRAAIQETNARASHDTILLPAGVYALTITGKNEDAAAQGDLDITGDLTLSGAGWTSSVVDGNSLDRVFDVFTPAAVVLSGLTVQNGRLDAADGPAYSGGGIRQNYPGSSLTLDQVRVQGNTAGDSGGGLYNNAGTAILQGALVVGNQARYAGGLRNTGTMTLLDTTVSGNQSTYYGGGLLSSSRLVLTSSTIDANTAGTNGGGVYVPLGTATLENSTISGNRANAGTGGGVWIYYQAVMTATNVTIGGNGPGGGIFNYHEQGRNQADSVPQALLQFGNIRLVNTIIGNNQLADCDRSPTSPPIESWGHNLDSDSTCSLGQPTDLPGVDPLLAPLADNGGPTPTHALLPGSPAIDAGDDAACPATDQRGVARPQGPHCDIGAYEVLLGGEANLAIGKSAGPDPVLAGAPLTYTLSITNLGPYTATAATVVDSLPAGTLYVGAAGSGWSCSQQAGVVTCTAPTLLFGTAPSVTVVVHAPEAAGYITNTATIDSATADPSPDDNVARVRTTVLAPGTALADLALTKTGGPDPAPLGAQLTYTLTVTNLGPDAATAVTVTDALPPGVVYGSATGPGWSCAQATGTVTCTRPGLALGAAPAIVVAATAPDSNATLLNGGTVSSQTFDPDASNNDDQAVIHVRAWHYVYLPVIVK